MKLRNRILFTVSPITLIGLLLLGITTLILMKERKEFTFIDSAKTADLSLVEGFSNVFEKNINDIHTFTSNKNFTQTLSKYLVKDNINQPDPLLNSIFRKQSLSLHLNHDVYWKILTDDSVVLARYDVNHSTTHTVNSIRAYLPKLSYEQNIQRIISIDKQLYALTINDITTPLISLNTTDDYHRIFLIVIRPLPKPYLQKQEYTSILKSLFVSNEKLNVFSPIKYSDTRYSDFDSLLTLNTGRRVMVDHITWNNYVIEALAELSYAEDRTEIFLNIFFVLVCTGVLAFATVLKVLNHVIITPITWLSDYVSSGEVFKKPDNHPSFGSYEIKKLYRGIVKTSRHLETVRRAMEEASLIDELTGLGNRRLFYKTLEKEAATSSRYNTQFALLLIDLDNFKYVNDAYGHDIGDKLLSKFSKLLRDNTRSEDTTYNIISSQHISRLGGDEFAVILKNLTSPSQSAIVADRIIKEMNSGITVEGKSMPVTSSIGISVYPTDAATPQSLMLCVDAAMYQAKEKGKNGYRFYNKVIAAQLTRELEIEKHLREAIADNKLELFVQPIFCAETLEIEGGEVLLRWTHDELGLVSPEEFIPIAEKVGIIKDIDAWVIERTFQQIQQTKIEQNITLKGFAINISALETRNKKFATTVKNLCEKYQVDPETVELEITETALIEDLKAAEAVTSELKNMGIKIALDDFGTGYSSISHLKDVKFDKIKIDRSFITEIDDKKDSFLVADISLLLAHGMNMRITAEGVETETQLEYLRLSGCNFVQGFKLARPVPMLEYIKLVKEAQPAKLTLNA